MSFPLVRHSRVRGNPVITRTPLDSRLRGNDLCTGFPPARERLVRGSLRGSWWLMVDHGAIIYPCFTRRLIPLFLHERYRQCRVTLGKSDLQSVAPAGVIIESFIHCFVLFELSFQIELILSSITVRNS